MKYKFFPTILLTTLLLSCLTPASRTCLLLSDNPQLVLVTNLYNFLHPSSPPFIFRYTSTLSPDQLTKGSFDLVIGRNLTHFSPYFRNIGLLLRFLTHEYTTVITQHKESFSPSHMLPLSFDLPIILSLSQQSFPLFLPIQTLESLRNTPPSIHPPFFGFIPFRDKKFLWYWSELEGVHWRRSSMENLIWDKEALERFIEKLTPWAEKDLYAAQRDFLNKYGYLGEVNLLSKGYTKATFSQLSHWMNYALEGKPLVYSFLTQNNRLLALQEDTTYLALSIFSSPDKPIQDFIRWITSFEGQENIIQELKRNSPHFYGFLNGFSFLSSVNREIIQVEYPSLAGHLPDTEKLELSQPLPFPLNPFIENIWYPWLEKKISSPAPPLEQAILEGKNTL